MSEKHIPDQRARWTSHQKQIGEQLRNYYLPPQLLALLKKLDPELPEGQDQYSHLPGLNHKNVPTREQGRNPRLLCPRREMRT
jgi:hypothetical protein